MTKWWRWKKFFFHFFLVLHNKKIAKKNWNWNEWEQKSFEKRKTKWHTKDICCLSSFSSLSFSSVQFSFCCFVFLQVARELYSRVLLSIILCSMYIRNIEIRTHTRDTSENEEWTKAKDENCNDLAVFSLVCFVIRSLKFSMLKFALAYRGLRYSRRAYSLYETPYTLFYRA